jgi:hypothetical protein
MVVLVPEQWDSHHVCGGVPPLIRTLMVNLRVHESVELLPGTWGQG